MLEEQVKVATRPVPRKGKALAWTELGGILGEEHQEASDEIHIPDYVMYDFGFPRETARVGRRHGTATPKERNGC